MRRKGRKIGRAAQLRRSASLRDSEVAAVRRARRLDCALVLIGLGAAAVASEASSTPLDLGDPSARWIEVRFEVSPADEPGSLDRKWSVVRRARLEPILETGRISIRIPATELEAQLRSTGTDTIAGSFTDFVWTLDPVSGHVERAGFTGRVHEHLRFGPIATRAAVEIRVDMTTEHHAGFVPGAGVLGIRTNRFCRPGDASGCVPVPAVRFDPGRGYVNAVGRVRAAHPLAEITAFSPLGEVEFREAAAASQTNESARSGSSGGEAVCSQMLGRSCPVDGGDT